MEPRTLQYWAAACGGELRQGSPSLIARRVVTDSRKVEPGDLFVPLKGERFDAHDFLAEVAHQGAVGAVVARSRLSDAPDRLPVIVVEDPRRAYGEMGAFYRREFELPLVCVGGSNGKTTTKELIAAALGPLGPVLKSDASHNNDVGVPGTLLKLTSQHRVGVLEVGTNHPGELAPLVRLVAPRIGVLTSIGREHLEFFEDLSGVVREEGWLAELLPPAERGGLLVLDGESTWTEELIHRTRARVVRVGWSETQDWSAELLAMDWSGTAFRVRTDRAGWSGDYVLNLPGRHSVPNALYALAVAAELGVDPAAARDGLAVFRPMPGRLNVRASAGVHILDDSYNANADSMRAALQTLSDLPCTGRRVAVLGDMAELGPHSESAHEEVGNFAAEKGIDAVWTVGRHAAITARAAGTRVGRTFPDLGAVAAALVPNLQAGDTLLVKASRSSGLDRLVEILLRQLELREQLHPVVMD